jgi:hypothetical protein
VKYFENNAVQKLKTGKIRCGDVTLCDRSVERTIFILCDGIGSGVYANIAAITCANRLMELIGSGHSMRAACESVALSMHGARKQEFPFCAFSAVKIMNNGHFTVFVYENPDPVVIKNGYAMRLKTEVNEEALEVVGETSGVLDVGDSLLLFSDGVTQAGLGQSYPLGIGIDGITEYINRKILQHDKIISLCEQVMDKTAKISGGKYVDDTTIAIITCREARKLNVFTGPPVSRERDKEIVEKFLKTQGKHAVCGSTTLEIVAREMGEKVNFITSAMSLFGTPPEYEINGIDLVSEGAIMLNQVNNILGEPKEKFLEMTVVERLCLLFYESDVILFMIGNAINEAHGTLKFKQLGLMPRQTVLKHISKKLREMGKLVIEENY